MTDDERLLEIATRLYAADIASGNDTDPDTDTDCALFRTERLIYRWRERTGAQGREQDVSDELLRNAISAARLATELTTNRQTAELFGDLSLELEKIQRARAAGKGEE